MVAKSTAVLEENRMVAAVFFCFKRIKLCDK